MIKKLITLLITLISINNISHVSFPVLESHQTFAQTNNKLFINEARADRLSRISLILTAVAGIFVLLFANSDLTSIGVFLITFLILALASVFAIFGLFSRKDWWKGLFALIATSLLAGLFFFS